MKINSHSQKPSYDIIHSPLLELLYNKSLYVKFVNVPSKRRHASPQAPLASSHNDSLSDAITCSQIAARTDPIAPPWPSSPPRCVPPTFPSRSVPPPSPSQPPVSSAVASAFSVQVRPTGWDSTSCSFLLPTPSLPSRRSCRIVL